MLTALKSDPELAEIPVIVVTITTDRGVALSLGAADFMTKPIERNRLVSVLNTLLHGRGSVLLIEDEPQARELTQRQLQRLDLQVIETSNGREAIAWLSSNPAPGMILLDLLMPEMDGFSVLDAIEKHPEWQHIPVVILTGKDLSVAERELLRGSGERRDRQGLGVGQGPRICRAPDASRASIGRKCGREGRRWETRIDDGETAAGRRQRDEPRHALAPLGPARLRGRDCDRRRARRRDGAHRNA